MDSVDIVYLCQQLLHLVSTIHIFKTHRVEMAVPCRLFDSVHSAVSMQVQDEALQLRDDTFSGNVNLGQPVDGLDPVAHPLQVILAHKIGFIDDDDVGMRDLNMGSSHDKSVAIIAIVVVLDLACHIIEALEDVFGVNERHNAIQVDGAAQAIVHPKERRKISRVGQACRFKQDVVELALFLHEGFNGSHSRIPAALVNNTSRGVRSLVKAAHLTEQQIQPLPTSIHSSTDSPSLLMVRDFSMSRAQQTVSA
jgi:hypothetical protein